MLKIYSNLHYLLLLTFTGNSLVFIILCFYTSGMFWVQLSSGQRGQFVVHHGCSSEPLGPIPHDSLHSSPFYLKGPRTAATKKPPETRGHPGCNDKSKNCPRAHKRRIKPPQALSFRYPWDSVSRSHQTLCHPLHPQCTNYIF